MSDNQKSARGQVTGKLKVALDAMVWRGLRYAEAGKAAGLTARAMRLALNKPHVCQYLAAGKQALRQSEGPRTVRRLAELRDQDVNRNAAVAAAKALEQIPDDHPPHAATAVRPGLVILVTNGGKAEAVRTIEHSAQGAGDVANPNRGALVLPIDRPRGGPG